VRAALCAIALAITVAGVAHAGDLVTDDGRNVDPDGHEHAGLLDLATVECGTYLSGAATQGTQNGATGYTYVDHARITAADAARVADHRWVEAREGTELVFDLGRSVSSVVVLPSIDHGSPLPGEALEYTAYGSDSADPGSLGEQGDISVIYDKGFSDWVSDDFAARWTFPAPHRFIHITAAGPGALWGDGDAEIDATCTDLPPPEPGQSANAMPESGSVSIKTPGGGGFVTLTTGDQIPVGSVVDATFGKVDLATATTTGTVQSATFSRGIFKVVQQVAATGLTELQLQGGASTRTCRASGAVHSAKKKVNKKVLRELFGRGHGIYKANGRHANLTVRGTSFVVQDRCDGTYVKLVEGRGTVLDKVRHKTIRLRAGQSYLARPR
jgi:hypothetical protein